MKKLNIALLAAAGAFLLGGCAPEGDSDQTIANAIASKSGLVMSSATNRGLDIGADAKNVVKYPAYLYVYNAFSTRANVVKDGKIEESVVTSTSIVWTCSVENAFKISASTGDFMKYTPNFTAEAQNVTLTGTVTYGSATATAIFNITLSAKD